MNQGPPEASAEEPMPLVALRFPSEMLACIDAEAARRGVSRSEQIRHYVDQAQRAARRKLVLS
jgi:hypothetical protein